MATASIVPSVAGVRNVLIAIDFSHQSDSALKYGLEFAHRFGARAEIVYVVPTDEFALAGPDGLQLGRDAARRDLLQFKNRIERYRAYNDDSEQCVSMLDGPVAECLLECARNKNSDLIVVGTHGRGSFGKIILGSVAEKVFRRSDVPVLTIGPYVHLPREIGAAPRILAPCDLSRKSHPAVEYACGLAKARNSHLTVLHVVDHPAGAMKVDPEAGKHAVTEQLMDIVGTHGDGLDVRYRVESGDIPSTILDVASAEADLIVLGVRPASGLLDRFMWPIAYELVREATCPVLTVRGAPVTH